MSISVYNGKLVKKKLSRGKVEVNAMMSSPLYEEIILGCSYPGGCLGSNVLSTFVGFYTDSYGYLFSFAYNVDNFKTLYDYGEVFTVYEAEVSVHCSKEGKDISSMRKSIQSVLGIKNVYIKFSEMA
jgi:hypothetical protein